MPNFIKITTPTQPPPGENLGGGLVNTYIRKEEIIRLQNKQLENMKIRLGISTLIAKSKAFHEVVELAQRIAAFDGATVLILGESGTGNVRELENVVENLVITTP